jgi:ATP-dependent Clp protease ATP-binding subunit ClpB
MANPASLLTVPRWLTDIVRLLPIRSQFLLSGNIRDYVVTPSDSGIEVHANLFECLLAHLRPLGFEEFVVFDTVDGLRLYPSHDTPAAHWALKGVSRQPVRELAGLSSVIKNVITARDKRCAVMIDFASRLTAPPSPVGPDIKNFFVHCEKLALDAEPVLLAGTGDRFFNPVFWLVNRSEDVPSWFTLDNERVHVIELPKPDRDQRYAAALHHLTTMFHGAQDATDAEKTKASELFASQTDSLTVRAMKDIASLAAKMQTPLADIDDAIRCFKVGQHKNPWKQGQVRRAIGTASDELAKRVKGQPQAIQKTVDILTRSVMGLTGAHAASAGTRPRGVLFFAGPTGVGKTELAKALTKLLFGDETAYIRFDMSEFSAEHSSDRLLGAPPGYVGYDAGGELTNAIRRRPFSVLLFDEIEKANGRVLDKFLQILEDGRLTDGKGSTVYFSESILVFTSNIGQERVAAEDKDDYAVVEQRIRDAIVEYFKSPRGPNNSGGLGRPELLNRFGDNIVVFNFIGNDVAEQIFDVMMTNIAARLKDEHDLTLRVPAPIRQKLLALCIDNLAQGGRGVANRLESVFVNPLSRALFATSLEGRTTVAIADLTAKDGVYTVTVK